MSVAVAEQVLTAEQYFRLPADGGVTELVRGRVVEMNPPGFKHGKRCARIAYLLSQFLDKHDLGHLISNDAGVVTERDPDTVRGADIAFYSYRRVPKKAEPEGYPDAVPELVFEVLSPSDTWARILRKVSEYLEAGVVVVCVVNPNQSKVFVYRSDSPAEELADQDEFTLPDLLPDFRVPVGRFFE
ncbi:MAG: Uma2 family endonuclease [Pirellulaceae bacterium]|nr:Uma2 family endonuclease [Pirellulaceae bacterium]